MADLFLQFRKEGRTILISTHDLGHVRDFCDLVVLINKTVLAYGETSDVFTKDSNFFLFLISKSFNFIFLFNFKL